MANEILATALDVTEQMLSASRHGNWLAVADLDIKRQRVLQEGFTAQPGDQASLGLLIEKNDALMQIAAAAFGAIEHELGQHQYNHKALNVYMSSYD